MSEQETLPGGNAPGLAEARSESPEEAAIRELQDYDSKTPEQRLGRLIYMPKDLNDALFDQIVEAFGVGASIKLISMGVGVSNKKLRNWLELGKQEAVAGFSDTPLSRLFLDCMKANYDLTESLVVSINDAAQAGEWKAAAWLLQRLHPEEFAAQQAVGKSSVAAGVQTHTDKDGNSTTRIFGSVVHEVPTPPGIEDLASLGDDEDDDD